MPYPPMIHPSRNQSSPPFSPQQPAAVAVMGHQFLPGTVSFSRPLATSGNDQGNCLVECRNRSEGRSSAFSHHPFEFRRRNLYDDGFSSSHRVLMLGILASSSPGTSMGSDSSKCTTCSRGMNATRSKVDFSTVGSEGPAKNAPNLLCDNASGHWKSCTR